MNGDWSKTSRVNDEEPIREELFSIERLEQRAPMLANEHQVSERPQRGRELLPRFEDNGRYLITVYLKLTEAVFEGQGVSPAAEWLIDNFHVVEEQLREIRVDLPKSYYYELPTLVTGEMRGYPRIYSIATTFIAHTDSRLDEDALRRFIRAYQQVTPLTIGDMWAMAITLRLALIENLRRLTSRVVTAREEREEADRLADNLLVATDEEQRSVVAGLIQQLEQRKQTGRAFVVQLTRRLRDQDPDVTPLVEWIDREAQSHGQSIEQIVQLEHQRQAASQVTVGNIITSMRLLSTIDWRGFVESVSLTEPILGADPAGAYAEMDFATRDRYRHVIERIARRAGANELDVARRAVELARQSHERGPRTGACAHVGYYLIDDGLARLEREFGYRPSITERAKRMGLGSPSLFYFGVFLLLSGFILTMIVMPTMLTSEAVADELVEKLEIHYLANQDSQFYFALLTDFADARAGEAPNDDALLAAAHEGIERLNARYGPDRLKDASAAPRFYLFHRRRQWNDSEHKWIGWERKRGKLEEFNRLLRGAQDTSFVVAGADAALLASIRYVITLDSDTRLPRDAARKLVATIRRPLNRAQSDPQTRRGARGYGILQPRVSVTLESGARSRFARIFSGAKGVDPYSAAASDVYQDLFAEGSFTGKGLYDVDAFQAALDARVPDNSLLSHDLFECLYARAALVTDVELLDDHPAHYDTYRRVWDDFGVNSKQVALTLVFLPHQAWLMGDAIARVAYRKLISGKRLLEWAPSDQTEIRGHREDSFDQASKLSAIRIIALREEQSSSIEPNSFQTCPMLDGDVFQAG
jgi:cyclic beta-1,2-glucan synthetase